MTRKEWEFYCTKWGHQWKIPLEQWSLLTKVTPHKLPKCPECGYENPAIVGKPVE